LFVDVETDGGNSVGVANVIISVCSFDGVKSTGRCWEAVTNVFGQAKVEVSVADEEWTEKVQYFQVRPVPQPLHSHCGGDEDGQSTFTENDEDDEGGHLTLYAPEMTTIAVRHMESQNMRWVGATAVVHTQQSKVILIKMFICCVLASVVFLLSVSFPHTHLNALGSPTRPPPW
jgi:hypothetical protein